tara:strand:+ start:304 stop:561 length:258 start_codon:yes stop_codon:yes gene_type:complete
MNDFKKGLLVGMLIIIGCGTFIAKTSNITSYNRYEPVGEGAMMLDTWKGNMYVVDKVDVVTGDRHWKLLASLEPKDENEKKGEIK